NAPAPLCAALSRYGLELGFAFQIADDLLDYTSDADTLGKNIGDDLAEGKVTLPLIYTLRAAAPAQAEVLRQAIRAGGGPLHEVLAIIRGCGALPRVRARAEAHAEAALAALEQIAPSAQREALVTLARYAVDR
ncbi:octylprenyl diphosphate synthase, partial [mine drainage metagenome]